MKTSLLIIAGVASLLAADLAAAQTPPAGPPGGPQGGPRGDAGPGGEHRMGPGQMGPGHMGPGQMGPGRMGRMRMRERPSLDEVKKRNAEAFARMDANKDGKVTFDEFRQEQERRRLERQREMFRRFSGGQDSITLDQMNARAQQRLEGRGQGSQGGSGPGQRPAR